MHANRLGLMSNKRREVQSSMYPQLCFQIERDSRPPGGHEGCDAGAAGVQKASSTWASRSAAGHGAVPTSSRSSPTKHPTLRAWRGSATLASTTPPSRSSSSRSATAPPRRRTSGCEVHPRRDQAGSRGTRRPHCHSHRLPCRRICRRAGTAGTRCQASATAHPAGGVGAHIGH